MKKLSLILCLVCVNLSWNHKTNGADKKEERYGKGSSLRPVSRMTSARVDPNPPPRVGPLASAASISWDLAREQGVFDLNGVDIEFQKALQLSFEERKLPHEELIPEDVILASLAEHRKELAQREKEKVEAQEEELRLLKEKVEAHRQKELKALKDEENALQALRDSLMNLLTPLTAQLNQVENEYEHASRKYIDLLLGKVSPVASSAGTATTPVAKGITSNVDLEKEKQALKERLDVMRPQLESLRQQSNILSKELESVSSAWWTQHTKWWEHYMLYNYPGQFTSSSASSAATNTARAPSPSGIPQANLRLAGVASSSLKDEKK